MLKLLKEYPVVLRSCGRMVPPLKNLLPPRMMLNVRRPGTVGDTDAVTETDMGSLQKLVVVKHNMKSRTLSMKAKAGRRSPLITEKEQPLRQSKGTKKTKQGANVKKSLNTMPVNRSPIFKSEVTEAPGEMISDNHTDVAVAEAEASMDNAVVDDISETEEALKPDVSSPQKTEDQKDDEIDIQDVFIVRDVKEAKYAMEILREAVRNNPDKTFACDTEVMNIDILKQSPRGHGSVICFSVYGGDDVIFDQTPSGIHQTLLWVDTFGEAHQEENAKLVLEVFEEFFEDKKFMKIWHNFGFDRHVMKNMGIDCKGFEGDTMHMGRLWNSSRKGKGYSLEALSTAKELNPDEEFKKTSMKELFGRRKIKKDNTEGKTIVVDPVQVLQCEQTKKWIYYSARDAKATYVLYNNLKRELMDPERFRCYMDPTVKTSYPAVDTLWDFYVHVWKPFGELLTEMEDVGFYVDIDHLKRAQQQAMKDQEQAAELFKRWVKNSIKIDGADYMNPGSDTQIRMLLFGGIRNRKNDKIVENSRVIKVPNEEYELHKKEKRPGRAPRKMKDIELCSLWGEDECPLIPEIWTAAGWPAVSASALRVLVGKPGVARTLLEKEFGEKEESDIAEGVYDIVSIEDEVSEEQLERHPREPTQKLMPTQDEITYHRCLRAQQEGLGSLYLAFDDHKRGLEACRAVEALIEMNAIDTLLTSFIIPLQGEDIKAEDQRIHGSMNINTETGRLSCRRPNLQNQPALEKDRYKVRESFRAAKGHTLIVADYGQLELRILAHLTNCKSMLHAFEIGGDFHSRTAMGMYDHIKNEVDAGHVSLEPGVGDGDLPLVKDVYSSERRKAKVLNFSIAYGKTAHGLSKDWKVSQSEAEDTLNRWYADRQEVRQWQQRTIAEGRKRGYVTTLLGRRRNLPELNSGAKYIRSRAERAAINTPIQGSAADIATVAMIAIRKNQRLNELGWMMLSQVHDEIILEGPKDSADEATTLVVQCMEHPFPSADGSGYNNPLRVKLAVDAKHADTWYDAK